VYTLCFDGMKHLTVEFGCEGRVAFAIIHPARKPGQLIAALAASAVTGGRPHFRTYGSEMDRRVALGKPLDLESHQPTIASDVETPSHRPCVVRPQPVLSGERRPRRFLAHAPKSSSPSTPQRRAYAPLSYPASCFLESWLPKKPG
jgi:hypothetical protein